MYLLEECAYVDDFGNSLCQFPGNALHERHHALIFIVVTRDNPHHAQSIHHGGNCLNHHLQKRPHDARSDIAPISVAQSTVIYKILIKLYSYKSVDMML